MSMQEFSDNLSTLSYVSRRRVPVWCYDSKKKAFLGRTARCWFLIGFYYFCFYSFLAGFFVGMLMIFMHMEVKYDKPMRTGMQSLIQFSPGLGFRPVSEVQKSLIKYAKSDPQQYLIHVENINAFLDTYDIVNAKPKMQFAQCSGDKKVPDDVEKVCRFSLDNLGPCSRSNHYGYPAGTPCILLKINKVYGWLPDIENKSLANHALVACTGQNPADIENMGTVEYYPNVTAHGKTYGYFDSIYFPYVGQAGYLTPLVAIKFVNPAPHVAILIECKIRNVKNSYTIPVGFELMVD
ncbi:unnamed protein product [Calicophoron daubneyi]|uniref:Sodium/potassium-transporting ATPase subunit beta n=1 Tax=Calicophoron daubneyi TaxID=300641 RepID=A0AAV2TWW1_CALDB